MSKDIRVLVVEEDQELQGSIVSALNSDGFDVQMTGDASGCVEAALKHSPQLIVLDVVEGLEKAVSDLKIHPVTRNIPVIIMVEGTSTEVDELASKICADEYVTKPFIIDTLADIIQMKLEKCNSVTKGHPDHHNTSVLVIDDEGDIRRIIELNLCLDGFKVYTAPDGPSGIKAARKYNPELILLDVMMPGMDGLEVLSLLKWDKALKDIPVIMLTAKSTMGDMDHAFNRRADGYITKPFDGKKLVETIKKKMERINDLSFAVGR
jgi:DNA-binding response OmpR family regulator